MGKLLKPRGLKGEVWSTIFNESDSALKKGCKIWLKKVDNSFVRAEIESLTISGKKSWIKFIKIDSRMEAESLHGISIFYPRSDFPQLGNNCVYLVDLIDATVTDENEKILGIVTDTLQLPAQNVIAVKADKKEVLIPFVDAHIVLFDKEKNILIVKDVEGLMQ